MSEVKNFALTGAAGYVAPRHLNAIRDTGNRLVAAVDPHDAVGVLDRYSFDVRFFTEIERFDRHLEKLRRRGGADRVDYVSICSPNYLHDAHIRLALRVGAHAICEKPLVINPWNLDALQELERETGGTVSTVLQLRLHPRLIALRERIARESSSHHYDVSLTYVTARGRWYDTSWKGSDERSGGIVINIGIHLFDLLLWLFGPPRTCEVHARAASDRRFSGAGARVRWFCRRLPIAVCRSRPQDDIPFDHGGRRRGGFSGLRDLTRVYESSPGAGSASRRAGGDRVSHQIRQAPVDRSPRTARW
jgi:UDP-N-acetyl-2-amino-2-deoxyglucuronate dehydrogenase